MKLRFSCESSSSQIPGTKSPIPNSIFWLLHNHFFFALEPNIPTPICILWQMIRVWILPQSFNSFQIYSRHIVTFAHAITEEIRLQSTATWVVAIIHICIKVHASVHCGWMIYLFLQSRSLLLLNTSWSEAAVLYFFFYENELLKKLSLDSSGNLKQEYWPNELLDPWVDLLSVFKKVTFSAREIP